MIIFGVPFIRLLLILFFFFLSSLFCKIVCMGVKKHSGPSKDAVRTFVIIWIQIFKQCALGSSESVASNSDCRRDSIPMSLHIVLLRFCVYWTEGSMLLILCKGSFSHLFTIVGISKRSNYCFQPHQRHRRHSLLELLLPNGYCFRYYWLVYIFIYRWLRSIGEGWYRRYSICWIGDDGVPIHICEQRQ